MAGTLPLHFMSCHSQILSFNQCFCTLQLPLIFAVTVSEQLKTDMDNVEQNEPIAKCDQLVLSSSVIDSKERQKLRLKIE